MRRRRAKIDLVMTPRDPKRLGQFSRAGAKSPNVFDTASVSHQFKAAPGLDCANQNQTITRSAFDEHVQHPVDTVVEIDVSRARLVSLDEGARTRAAKRVTGFVVLDQIRFSLDDETCAFSPNELGADQILCALERIDLKKTLSQHADKLADRSASAFSGATYFRTSEFCFRAK